MPTEKLNLPIVTGNMAIDVQKDLNALAEAIDGELGDLENYSIATKAEAETGTSSVKYMTPLRTKEAIMKLAPPPTAEKVTITDTGNYYSGTNTEAALQEIGQVLNGTRGSIITAVNQLLTL